MSLILITSQLKNKYPNINISPNQKIITPHKDINKNIEFFKTIIDLDIIIYDHTINTELENYTTTNVVDHINKTGYNPIIGRQSLMPDNFIDITNLYKDSQGEVTDCLGDRFDEDHKNYIAPSHFICYIAMLLHGLGCKKIKGKLINIL